MRNDLELTEEEQAEVEEQVERLREWLESDEGKQAVRNASKRSKEANRRREKARRISPLEMLERTP